MAYHIIALAGVSGSGKTTLAKGLCQQLSVFGMQSDCVHLDAYYKDFTHLPCDQRAMINFDHPDSFDWQALFEDFQRYKAGHKVVKRHYDYHSHRPFSGSTHIAADCLILEGILPLHDVQVRELVDQSVYLDVPLNVCFERRLHRDVAERGRTEESVSRQWLEHVEPMFEAYIYPQKAYADWTYHQQGDPQDLAHVLYSHQQELG